MYVVCFFLPFPFSFPVRRFIGGSSEDASKHFIDLVDFFWGLLIRCCHHTYDNTTTSHLELPQATMAGNGNMQPWTYRQVAAFWH